MATAKTAITVLTRVSEPLLIIVVIDRASFSAAAAEESIFRLILFRIYTRQCKLFCLTEQRQGGAVWLSPSYDSPQVSLSSCTICGGAFFLSIPIQDLGSWMTLPSEVAMFRWSKAYVSDIAVIFYCSAILLVPKL
jgi:hypothetical protein